MDLYNIIDIQEYEQDEVWDITFTEDEGFLENEANFIAQNIVVHNCHAAGIVISPVPLSQICPMHTTRGVGDQAVVATQFTQYEVESLGLIKLDILGLSTKTAIDLAVKMIKERQGVDLNLAKLPLDDQKTLDLLNSGHTDGCFQLENYGMKQTLMQIGIDTFDDLIVAVAMYRPGPKDYIPEFSQRKKGGKVEYSHPLMAKITSRTYGIMAYQEQVMQVFMVLAGLTASDGYHFMKGCAKKKPEIIAESKEMFFQGARQNNISGTIIERIWQDMEKFAGYAFNKSHACSYAYESFKTAYLKAHFQIEFFAARLSVEASRRNFDDVKKYEEDAKKHGINIQPVDLNRSKMTYAISGENELLRPLIIKGVGDKAAEEIISKQPFQGSDRFFAFADSVGTAVNAKVVEALIDAGLFGDLKRSAKMKLLKDFEQIRKDKKTSRGRPQGDIFG